MSIVLDTSSEAFVNDCIDQGDTYDIPLSFAVNKDSLMRWDSTEAGVKGKVLALTQSPHVAHEIINHTLSHPHLTNVDAFKASYTGAGTGTIVVSGTYPLFTVTVNNDGVPVAALDITADDYGGSHRDLTTITGLRLAIDDLADWSTIEGTGGGDKSASLKVGTTAITTNTSVPFDIDTDYNHWKTEITGMTTWLESFMGANYVKAFVIPYAVHGAADYTTELQAWLNANITATHAGSARTMNFTEATNPIATMIPNNLSQIMGIGTITTVQIVTPDSATATEATIRNNARSVAIWAAETGNLGVITVHETECTATQLGYILDEFNKAQDITIKTFGNLTDHIRTSGLWTDAGGGTWNRTLSDLSDYRLQSVSPAIDAGTDISLTIDYAGNPIYGAPDIGAYEYQPPHTMGTSEIDIAAGARVYGDGKFRDKGTTSGTTADLTIMPQSSSFTTYADEEVRPAWMDITDITWSTTGTHHKQWIEASTVEGLTNTIHTVGDLEANKYYTVSVDNVLGQNITGPNCTSGVCQASSSGKITFTYTGTYSQHSFTVEEGDNTPPVLSNGLPAGPQNTNSSQKELTLTTSENATCKYGLTPNTAYASLPETFTTTGATIHAATLTNLANGQTYTYYVKCLDTTGNANTADYSISFTIAPEAQNVSLEKPEIKIAGESQKIKKDKVKSKKEKFSLRGQAEELANGTIKIYRDGKLWKRISASAQGAWSKTVKVASGKDKLLKIRQYDQYGTLLATRQFKVEVDSEKPVFTAFPKLMQTAIRGTQIHYQAKDNEKIKKYKITLGGYIENTKNTSYTIPKNLAPGLHTLTIKAYDEAGNSTKKQTLVSVR
jgi:hypothetical protein